MYTEIDRCLYGGMDMILDAETQEADREFARNLWTFNRGFTTYDEVAQIARVFPHRFETSIYGIQNFLERLTSEKPVPQRGTPARRANLEKLLAFAQAHEKLEQRAKRIEIQIPESGPFSIMYSQTDYEAVAGIYFAFVDEGNELPFFIIRGNPQEDSNGFAFSIRTVQPWISEKHTLSEISKRDFWALTEEDEEPEEIRQVYDLLKRREKRAASFEKAMNKGHSIVESKTTLSLHDSVLVLGISYLQGLGVTYINGISQNHHPEKRITENDIFAYDDFFSKWGQYNQAQEPHPWIIRDANAMCHIPKFSSLPATARKACMDVFAAAQTGTI